MNKRIKELSKQAQLVADATYANGPDSIWLKEYNKKFAELIVRECLSVIEEMNPHDPERNIDDIFDEVDEHFGVEE